MSVDFSNVQVGDRIKLVREGTYPVEMTFMVGSTTECATSVFTGVGMARREDWDTLEILEKTLPEAPTRTGVMIHSGNRHKPYVVLDRTGRWNSEYGLPISETEVRENLRDGWKVVFEGLDYDA